MNFTKLLLTLTLPLYVLDQLTKFWTVFKFPPPSVNGIAEQPVIEGFFYLVRVHNQGVAFGIGNGSAWAPFVFMIVPLLALMMIRIFWVKGAFNHPLARLAVSLLLCGILGNFTDRCVQGFVLEAFKNASFFERLIQGYVVDFISIELPFYGRWPAFNVADSCICIAAGMLFISGILEERAKAKTT